LLSKPFSQGEWKNIIEPFRDLSLMQTWEHAETKARTGRWKIERHVFLNGEQVVGAAQALIWQLPLIRRGIVRINRGPLWRKGDEEEPGILTILLKELHRYWVEKRNMNIQIVPPILEKAAGREMFESAGYQINSQSKNWSSTTIDLTRPEKDIRSSLSGNWRKLLGRVERSGVLCRETRTTESFERFLVEFRKSNLERKLSTSVTDQYLKTMQMILPEDRKMWFFEGWLESEWLGGLLMAQFGDTCMSLALVINDKGRLEHGGYVIHWQAILKM